MISSWRMFAFLPQLQYKHNFVQEKGKHIGARSILDDTNLLHCLDAAKLQSELEYKRGSKAISSHYRLPLDMVNLVHAQKAQNLVSDQDYRKRLHDYTVIPEDLKMKWAKRAHLLQSEVKRHLSWVLMSVQSEGGYQLILCLQSTKWLIVNKYGAFLCLLKTTTIRLFTWEN